LTLEVVAPGDLTDGAAVDLQDRRIPPPGVEVRWIGHKRLDLGAIVHGVTDLLPSPEPVFVEELGVQIGKPVTIAATSNPEQVVGAATLGDPRDHDAVGAHVEGRDPPLARNQRLDLAAGALHPRQMA